MVNITINGTQLKVKEGTSILDAAIENGIKIPHLCYLKDINVIGACRMCCVEVEGEDRLIPACENNVHEGMVIRTDTAKVRSAQRTNLELILSQHNGYCPSCTRNGSCQLQKLAEEYNISVNPYPLDLPSDKFTRWPQDFPLIRDASKCIKCMRCISVCEKVQSLGIWDLEGSGGRTHIVVSGGKTIDKVPCSICGQCITHCPVGALHERDDVKRVVDAINDPDKITVVQIAPAVRASWGEAMGLSDEKATVNLLAGALKTAGFDYVFDTSFSADLTIMEEGSEFLERLKKGDLEKYPMFTSCCPGWVRFIKTQFPELVGQLSSAKSPQQMFGSVIKDYFAKSIGKQPKEIFSVSIMPCTAKKAECDIPTMERDGVRDVDCVLTTREVTKFIKSCGIDINKVQETQFDRLMGDYTGAGVIFGATGGVMEAALRSAYFLVTGKNPDADAFKEVRATGTGATIFDEKPWRELSFELAGRKLSIAVASSLGNARKICQAIVDGRVKYDFVEIMACPGGCAGGGGQIILGDDVERAKERGTKLYRIDKSMAERFSHENPDVLKLYKDDYGAPLSHKSEEYLHTDHCAWNV